MTGRPANHDGHFVPRTEFDLYRDSQERLQEAHAELIKQGFKQLIEKQDATNEHLAKLNGQTYKNAESISTNTHAIGNLTNDMKSVKLQLTSAASSAESIESELPSRLMKKKGVVVGGLIGIIYLLVEFSAHIRDITTLLKGTP